MSTTVVVVRPFGPHAKGDVIAEPAAIAEVLAGENAHYVVRVIPAPPAPPSQGS